MTVALSRLGSRAQDGIQAPLVVVEAHLGPGLPTFQVVGLPEAAVKEARDRVRSAIATSGFAFPQQRITVNLAPADLPKGGGRFDLAMAVGILVASGQVPPPPEDCEFIAELGLDGSLRPVPGVLPAALASTAAGHQMIIASDNLDEAQLCRQARLRSARTLLELCTWLAGRGELPLAPTRAQNPARTSGAPCLADIRGQPQARRALEIAAAGNHSLLLCGPPGAGKSMLAARLPGILPPLDEQQALEVACVYSLQKQRPTADFLLPPFRHPHHTASAVALVGGGSSPRPGEISLSHHGVLFLDELPEFDRKVLEVMREPLETGEVQISRAARQANFPARFQLIAAMNPCPCGYLGDPKRSCGQGYQCEKARRYQARLSGPLLDRIDLQLDVRPLAASELLGSGNGECSETVRARVIAARQTQRRRQGCTNNLLGRDALESTMQRHQGWLENAMDRLGLSARALVRLVRVARTIADLAGEADILLPHLQEALTCRQDRSTPAQEARR